MKIGIILVKKVVKESVNVNISDTAFIKWHVRFTMVPFKALSAKESMFLFLK